MNLVHDTLLEARQDIVSCGEYLFERNPSAALKFADAVDETIEMLCHNPELGERFRADLTGQIRFRTISGFKN